MVKKAIGILAIIVVAVLLHVSRGENEEPDEGKGSPMTQFGTTVAPDLPAFSSSLPRQKPLANDKINEDAELPPSQDSVTTSSHQKVDSRESRRSEFNNLDSSPQLAIHKNKMDPPSSGADEGGETSDGREKEDSDRLSERFEKLDASGNPLPREERLWSCVVDNFTGLVWEVKSAEQGLHYTGSRFSWYYPELSRSGIFPGLPEPSDGTCSQSPAEGGNGAGTINRCNTQGFEVLVNEQMLCGYSGWRLPTVAELKSIVSLDRKSPAIDMEYFPNTQIDYYWTASSHAYDDRSSWAIDFRGGIKNDQEKKLGRYVRLVSAPQRQNDARTH